MYLIYRICIVSIKKKVEYLAYIFYTYCMLSIHNYSLEWHRRSNEIQVLCLFLFKVRLWRTLRKRRELLWDSWSEGGCLWLNSTLRLTWNKQRIVSHEETFWIMWWLYFLLLAYSANKGDSSDRRIDSENQETKDFLILVSV